ncbi:hypothetical protein BJV82DRAFT_609748 [Fennellomyces sp. T-0311]|nr:hypothetical protein BJV82DRAFT_609748 [Fennellomyces sp. T-0311]
MESGVISPEITSARQENQPHRSPTAPRHDASISALLNDKQTQIQEDYLPTPVTPATGFPLLTSTKSLRPNELSAASPLPSPQPTSEEERAQKKAPVAADKPYACTECNQTFSRPHNLKSHLTTHSSERPFQCDICKNYFRRHHDLKRHRKLHTGERPYTCNVCHRSFARLDALNRHCRAEGGTACSNVHRVQGRRPLASSSSPPPQRPIVPQLQIANPASKPVANEVYPYPPTTNSSTTITTPVASPPSANRIRDTLLPSPGALSRLPVSESTNLVPIQKLHSEIVDHEKAGSAYGPFPHASPTVAPHHQSTPPPYYGWASPPPRDRILPLPNRYPSNNASNSSEPWERLRQENVELRQEVAYWQSAADQLNTLKSQLHDLQIENKVLRSLITEAGADEQHSKRKIQCRIKEEESFKRRRNSD